jgi:sugar-specific transcriptional regulator TrmB
MAVDDKEAAALQRLGLTEYESRIYLVLVKMGPIKASEISFFGQVPRTKTYGAIKELERKGLLKIVPGKPEVYAPASPNDVLMPLVTRLNREVKDSEGVVQSLHLAYESSKFVKRDLPKEANDFWRIDGRQFVLEKLNQIFKDAQRQISYSTSSMGLIRLYKAQAEVLETAKKQGVAVRLLAPITTENAGVAQQLAEIIDIKKLEKPFRNIFAAVDGAELIIVESKPEDLRTDRGSDFAIWTKNKLMIELYEDFFERFWKTTPSFEFSKEQSSDE